MATVTEGVYRISLVSSGYGDQFLTAVDDQWVALLPADGQWAIWHCDDGYTLGQANTDTYAVYDNTPDLGEPLTLACQPCAWTITDGPQQDTVSFGVPNIGYPPLTLGPARALVYPPASPDHPPGSETTAGRDPCLTPTTQPQHRHATRTKPVPARPENATDPGYHCLPPAPR